jgi:hypothetical protein
MPCLVPEPDPEVERPDTRHSPACNTELVALLQENYREFLRGCDCDGGAAAGLVCEWRGIWGASASCDDLVEVVCMCECVCARAKLVIRVPAHIPVRCTFQLHSSRGNVAGLYMSELLCPKQVKACTVELHFRAGM